MQDAKFQGRYFTFTGRLASMSRSDACRCVALRGGRVTATVSSRTGFVVVGSDGWPLRTTGRLTRALVRAEEFQRAGHAIEVLSEAAFLRRLDLHAQEDSIRRLFSLEELSRMLGISGLRLRRWVREGVLQPVDAQDPILRFDFLEVTAARTIQQLLKKRPSLPVVLDSLRRLRRWMPEDRRLAEHVVRLSKSLVVRDPAGRMIDSSGQYCFSFEDGPCSASEVHSDSVSMAGVSAAVTPTAQWSADALFDRAFDCQQRGDHAAAAQHYRNWLARYGADKQVLFNLGNALAEANQHDEAILAFRRCVALAPTFACAWNNLGLSLASADQIEAAIAALSRAIEVDPGYADACYNLADLLDEAGRQSEACDVWMRYLSHRQTGEHSRYAEQRLHELAGSQSIGQAAST